MDLKPNTFLWLFSLCLLPLMLPAQVSRNLRGIGGVLAPDSLSGARRRDSGFVIIRHIIITGNKRTQPRIILREFGLKPGDTLFFSQAMKTLEVCRQQVINSSLFLRVSVYFKAWSGHYTDIAIDVIERWYLFPFPIFSLADRNFNVWWVEKHHSLSRVNYGLNFYDNNVSGNNDQMILSFQSGYTHRYLLTYQLPYFDKQLRSGMGFEMGYSRNREISYQTSLNKLEFLKTDQFISQQFYGGLTYSYQRNIRVKHQFSLDYHYLGVSDTVTGLNPSYLPGGRNEVRFLSAEYKFSFIGADNWAYPLRGFNFFGTLTRMGFGPSDGINLTRFQFNTARYFQVLPHTFLSLGLRGQLQFPADQPYFLSGGMGYAENYLRGLEYYVVDGGDYLIWKCNLKKALFHIRIRTYVLPRKFAVIPITVYAKIFSDLGYAANNFPGNSFLNNRLLYTEGFGIDIVSFYDLRIRLEYSFNQLGQNGLFLHTKSEL